MGDHPGATGATVLCRCERAHVHFSENLADLGRDLNGDSPGRKAGYDFMRIEH